MSKIPQELCPVGVVQDIISGRWKIIILWHLSRETMRFSQLRRLLPGISQGVLTKQLRELERDGMIHREMYKEVPPRVEYSLTDSGSSFLPVLDAIAKWAEGYIGDRGQPPDRYAKSDLAK